MILCAGCGGSDEQSDEDAVREVALQYADALVAGDGETACSLLTAESVEAVEADGSRKCEQISSEKLPVAGVGAVSVSGETATAEFGVGPDPSTTTNTTIPLVREDGEWRVDAVGLLEGLGSAPNG